MEDIYNNYHMVEEVKEREVKRGSGRTRQVVKVNTLPGVSG